MIDLKAEFSDRFIVKVDPVFFLDYEVSKVYKPDPWYFFIPGTRGDVYPHGEGALGCATKKRHNGIEGRIGKIPGAEIWQNGSDGINFIFPPEAIDEVHKYVKLRVRKKFSEGHREKLRRRLKEKFNGSKGDKTRKK